MPRTTPQAVQGVLGGNYDGAADLGQYIAIASPIVDRVVTCATAKRITLTTAEQELIERWLSAHYYTKMDPVYLSKNTGGAGGSFVRDKEQPEPYKDGAINVDYSGCLNSILGRKVASLHNVGGGRHHHRGGCW